METYQHSRFRFQNGIRVFDLHGGDHDSPVCGSIREVQLPEDVEAAPHYTALSYTWGSPKDMSPTPIWIDNKPLKVRNNLMSALRALRHHQEDRTYWIDAICINQADVSEKNHQVASMARIYQGAEAVKIWLGVDDDSSRTALAYVRETSKKASSTSPIPEAGGPLPISAMQALMRRDYWFRAWIIQEVVLAHDIDVHCGSAVVEWGMLVRTCLALQASLPDSPAIQLMARREAALQDDQVTHDETLESLIRTYSRCGCSDRRDRIFALLSLASDCTFSQGLQPDYRMSRLELLVRVLEFCRPENPIEFVSLMFEALGESDSDTHWVGAKQHWMQVQTQEPSSNPGTEIVGAIRVTRFMAISTAERDWVSHEMIEANATPGTQEASHLAMPGFQTAFNLCRASGTAPATYSTAVHPINSHNLAVIIGPYHVVIFSVDTTKAVVSPCESLRLHDSSDNCNWARCMAQVSNVNGPY